MPDSPDHSVATAPVTTGRPQVCVIDESRAVRSFVTSALSKLNINLQEFDSGNDGFNYLTAEQLPFPTLIIIESHYRNIEALNIIKTLRSTAETEYVPILIFSYTNDEALIKSFMLAGADEFIHKPCKPEEMATRVQLLLWNLEELESRKTYLELPVVVVDTDLKEIPPLRTALSMKGHAVICTANPITAMRHCKSSSALAMLELALPGINVPQLIKDLSRSTGVKVITMSATASNDLLSQAVNAGSNGHLRKPIIKDVLNATLEQVLEYSPDLGQIEIEPQYLRRLVSGTRPFPPLMEGEITYSFEEVVELFAKNPGLAKAKVVLSGKTVFIKGEDAPVTENTGSTVSTQTPHPFLRDGYPITQEAIARILAAWRQDPKAIITEEGEVAVALSVLQNYDFGKYLYNSAPITNEDLIAIIRHRPNLFGALKQVERSTFEEGINILTGVFDYLDNFFIFKKFRAENLEEMLQHMVCVALLSILAGIGRLRESGEIDPEQRQAVLTVLGISGFLHDLGYIYDPLPSRDNPRFTSVLNKHAENGFLHIEGCKTFGAVKCIIRDHHTKPGKWKSKFNSATHLVQVANDLDNLLRPMGMLILENTVEPSPEPYSFEETCLILIDRAASNKCSRQDVNSLLSGLGVAIS
ncbi:MAG: response regulator [Planctomycetes bacterium]|nr:response regulator [Planctomycetota bacterium]